MSDELNEKKATEEGHKPLQFQVIHLIIVTVCVAVLCALARALGFKHVAEYVGLNLVALFLFAFVKCCYAVPRLFERYRSRNVIHFGLGLFGFVIAMQIIGIFSLGYELILEYKLYVLPIGQIQFDIFSTRYTPRTLSELEVLIGYIVTVGFTVPHAPSQGRAVGGGCEKM